MVAKISEYQMPNDQKMYAKQLGQLFFSKISYNFITIKLILKFKVFLNIFL